VSATDTICEGCGLLTGSTNAWLQHTQQCVMFRGRRLRVDEADRAARLTRLVAEHEALTKVYVAAARLRQFPVPFDDHWALVGAVDECRSVLEPLVDDYSGEAASPSAWQARVNAYPREEFLATFREAHAALHRLWTAAVGKDGYDKELWKTIDNALARFARDAAEGVGIGRSEPLR
jgi:hypothetical protein